MSASEQHQRLYSGSTSVHRLAYSIGEVQGVTILVVVSCISLVAIIGLLLAISISAFNTRRSGNEHLFVRTHVAAYFVSLLFCDILQAIGSIINVTWINQKSVAEGSICVFQGVMKQSSDIGTAFWAVIIAVHTFCLLFLELKIRRITLWITLCGGWSALIALVLLGPATINTAKQDSFYNISGYWCWISPQYRVQRITLDYMIMFLAAFLSFVLYALIFLRLRGNIVQSGWRIRFRGTSGAGAANWRGRKFADDQTMTIARKMLLYPIAYTLLVLPISVARLAAFAGHRVTLEAMIFCDAVFLLSGFVNVVLFITTRRLLPVDSLNIGKWAISHPREPPSSEDNGVDPSYQTTQIKPGIPSEYCSGDSAAARSSSDHSTTSKQIRKARPADIIIHRDSIESMYSVYDEEEIRIPPARSALEPPPMTSVWSPDGSPQRRSWRY